MRLIVDHMPYRMTWCMNHLKDKRPNHNLFSLFDDPINTRDVAIFGANNKTPCLLFKPAIAPCVISMVMGIEHSGQCTITQMLQDRF